MIDATSYHSLTKADLFRSLRSPARRAAHHFAHLRTSPAPLTQPTWISHI